MMEENRAGTQGKATFIVQVQFQQNASWQGTVGWTEKRKSQHFRSMLELIKLMDDALGANETEPLIWDREEE